MEIIWQIIVVIVLVLLNGYFVASEFALVALRKTRIAELAKKGNRAAKMVQMALDDLDSFISSTQLGITVASLGLGWVGEPVIARYLEKALAFLPKNIAFFSSHSLAVVLAFSTITFLHVVLGELGPKTIALQRSESVSLIIIGPLLIFTKIFRPFIWVLNGAGGMVLRIFGYKSPKGHQLVHSEEEIKMILAQSAEGGKIEKKEAEMVNKLFRFGDIEARKIMLPRSNIIAFSDEEMVGDILKKISNGKFSRFPIYKKSINKILGFVHIKDIYNLALGGEKNKKIKDSRILRKIIKVPENKMLDEVLYEMKFKRTHIAVVVNRKGNTQGIITLEDTIERIVGDIEDEFERN